MSDKLLNRVIYGIETLRIKHLDCDDPHYSCPKCMGNNAVGDCICGAEDHNSKVDALLKLSHELKKEVLK